MESTRNVSTQRKAMATDRRDTRASMAPRRPRGGSDFRRRPYDASRSQNAIDGSATTALNDFLGEHAVKTGMLVFYAWFVLANWTRLMQLPASLFSYVVGLN